MMGPNMKTVCHLTLLAGLALAQVAAAQESNPALDAAAMQKKLGEVQGKNTMPAKAKEGQALKRRDLKGQAMSQSEPEGLTPEQKKMYEEVQQQLQQIKENRAKSDAALEELMKGETGR